MDIKLVDKIQKLLALSESSNENEAHTAMLKAQELLIKHKLSLKEVKEFKINNSSIKEKISKITFTKGKWKATLSGLIADNFGCYRYFKTNRTNTIVFFGREEDITVCNIVLEYAIDCINSAVKRLRYEYTRFGETVKGIESDYALGFISGLKKKFEEQKRRNQEWGLVLVKDKEVVEAHSKINFTKTINTNVKYKGNSFAYINGLTDGKNFSISDKIAEGEYQEPLKIATK